MQDLRKVSFKENKSKTDKDTYTAVSKSERNTYSVKTTSNVPDDQSEKFETRESSLVALKVLSSSGNELPFIDDTRGNDASNELNIVTGGSSACGSKQKRILPTVQEYGSDEQSVDEEDFALNQAIIDAARLEYKEQADLAVDSILIENISPEIEQGAHQNNKDKNETQD